MNHKRFCSRAAALVLAVVLSFSCMAASGHAAETTSDTVGVRVNGYLVEFPDQAPYINADGRTLIPVRFVAEELGATVTWNNATRTATIEKNGVTINLPIGSRTMTVTEGNATRTVTMDTEAVITGGRTMVPIRYVAEALGAYVDYADAFRVVGIFSDVLTAEEIAQLRSYDYTVPKNNVPYERAKASGKYTADELVMHYGEHRHTFGNFANAREFEYYDFNGGITLRCNDYGKSVDAATAGEYMDAIVKEAIAEIAYSSKNLTVTFRADQSCVYQSDDMSGVSICVRGIVTATAYTHPLNFTWEEISLLSDLGYTIMPKEDGIPLSHAVDVHMNLLAGYNVHINTIVKLDK